MLDQNTDRMWFVIGAVIVGAAIIFIANGTLPDIFASVTDTFDEVSDKGLDRVEIISRMNETNGVNLLPFSSDNWIEVNVPVTALTYASFLSLDDLGLKPGDAVTMSGIHDFGDYSLSPRFMFAPEKKETNDRWEMNRTSKVRYTDEGYFEHYAIIPEGANYLTLRLNNQNYNGQGGDFKVKYKHLKLERGPVATPY